MGIKKTNNKIFQILAFTTFTMNTFGMHIFNIENDTFIISTVYSTPTFLFALNQKLILKTSISCMTITREYQWFEAKIWKYFVFSSNYIRCLSFSVCMCVTIKLLKFSFNQITIIILNKHTSCCPEYFNKTNGSESKGAEER